MTKHKYPGHFVSLEGGEGSGKSSLIANLKEATKGMDDILFVNDPSVDLETTRMFRELLLSDKHDLENATELMLYMCARCELVHKIIVPALKDGKLVISDRFDLSTWGYQCAGRGMDKRDVTMLSHLIGGLDTDMFIVLALDPEIGLGRSKSRLAAGGIDEGKFEALDLEFHNNVFSYMCGAGYRDSRGRVVQMTAETTEAEVLKSVLELIEEKGFI